MTLTNISEKTFVLRIHGIINLLELIIEFSLVEID
jgi:hypothetical protein